MKLNVQIVDAFWKFYASYGEEPDTLYLSRNSIDLLISEIETLNFKVSNDYTEMRFFNMVICESEYIDDFHFKICSKCFEEVFSIKIGTVISNEKIVILNLNNMDNQSLQRANEIAHEIKTLKQKISQFEKSHGIGSVSFELGNLILNVDKQYVNFESFKKQTINSMKKVLSSLEKEFAKI